MIRKVGGIYFVKLGGVGGSFYMSKPKQPVEIPGIRHAIRLAAGANVCIWSAVLLKAVGF